MKSIARKYIFLLKEIVCWSVMAILFSLTIFVFDNKLNFPVWATVATSIILFAVMFYLYLLLFWNIKKPFCTYEIDGKLIDYILIFDGGNNMTFSDKFSVLLTVEYKYKKKTYKKSIRVLWFDSKRIGSKLKIRTGKIFHNIIYIENI